MEGDRLGKGVVLFELLWDRTAGVILSPKWDNPVVLSKVWRREGRTNVRARRMCQARGMCSKMVSSGQDIAIAFMWIPEQELQEIRPVVFTTCMGGAHEVPPLPTGLMERNACPGGC